MPRRPPRRKTNLAETSHFSLFTSHFHSYLSRIQCAALAKSAEIFILNKYYVIRPHCYWRRPSRICWCNSRSSAW
ncbi:hypothetical protein [Rubritalea tangerina]|uniref:hypothetical protein n=1 Tax=Rubritalea tangerina TaxID=430798 RepID=UPI003617E0AC